MNQTDIEQRLRCEVLERFLDTLPPVERVRFVLRYSAGLPLRETAKRCGGTMLGTVFSLLKTRRALGRFLRKEGWL